MTVYEGRRTIDGLVVTVDGKRLDEHYEVKRFTRFGFEWTYEGDSPQQLALAARAMPGPDHEQGRHLALGPGGRLGRDRGEAGDREQRLLELVDHAQRALAGRVPRERMVEREARQHRQLVVDLGIVLHRARAERIEATVDVVVENRELDEVP